MGENRIVICIGSSCFARGNAGNVEIVEKFLADHGLRDEVDVDVSGGLCAGRCADGPIVSVNGRIYTKVDGGVMLDILQALYPATERK